MFFGCLTSISRYLRSEFLEIQIGGRATTPYASGRFTRMQMCRRKETMPFAPIRKHISPKRRSDSYLISRKVPCAGKDFFDTSSLLAHDTLCEVAFSVVERCRPGRQHIKIPPHSQRVWRVSTDFRYAKAAHPNAVFLLGGLAIDFSAKQNRVFYLLLQAVAARFNSNCISVEW